MDSWERESASIYDQSPLANIGPELCARSSIQNSELVEAEAPPLVSRSLESANGNFEPRKKNVDGLKQSISPGRADAAASVTNSKTISSYGSRTVVIFGMLSFTAGLALGAILVPKSGPNLQARPSSESIAAANLASAKTTPVAASAAGSNLSETANQLKSVGTELTSLRQDIRSLAGELAQIREAQQDLMAAQAQRKPQRAKTR